MISTADSSGSYPLLQTVFQGNIALRPKAMGRGRLASLSLICSRKAGYTAHSVSEQREGDQFLTGSSAPHCRFHPVPLDIHQPQRDAIGVRQSRVSTARGSVLHAIEARPQALTSSIHPKLGVRSKHQRLHRYARLRIFRPVLGIA